MSPVISVILCLVIGYLLGSISVGVIYSKWLGRDIRTAGSKNSGATNMTRIHGMLPGLVTFGGDCLKGVIAALIGKWIFGLPGAMLAGMAVLIGHCWPVFFGFRGGKGVATAIGVGITVFPPYGLIGLAAGVIVMFVTKFVSLGSLVGVTLFAILVTILYGFWPIGLWAIWMDLLVIWRHRENIKRLLNGTERKMGDKEKK
ncbi:MAG: glycerol-3-phosphate 1-O-acyltransferase PlsY [Clostridia bacterium]|nr:glycerol-3-phosphate 1-O-acyltransferase PlsY [Clostridia bacterium]